MTHANKGQIYYRFAGGEDESAVAEGDSRAKAQRSQRGEENKGRPSVTHRKEEESVDESGRRERLTIARPASSDQNVVTRMTDMACNR